MRRLAAAVRAAWWTLLIGFVAAIVQFLMYTIVSHTGFFDQLVPIFGPGVVVDTLRLLMLGFMLAIRLVLAVWLLGTLFLTLWLRRLRRVGDA